MKKVLVVLVIVAMSSSGAFALIDSLDTFALWHMDSTVTSGSTVFVPDDDSLVIGRNRDLVLVNGADLGVGTGFDGTGHALELDGIDDYGSKNWGPYDTIKVEMAFKPDVLSAATPQYLVEIAGILRLYINSGSSSVPNTMQFTIWDSAGVAINKNTTAALPTAGVWYTLSASYDPTGKYNLAIQ